MKNRYSATLLPCAYEDFFQTAKGALTREITEKLRKALDFKFQDEGTIRYPQDRIALHEKQIRKRAARILKGG